MTLPPCRATAALCWWSLLASVAACAAPAAKPAQGPAADAVKRGIASGTRGFDHGGFDALLARRVDAQGRVDYAGLRSERAALDGYLSALAGADLAVLSRNELLALLINAYNACTLRLILDGAKGETLPGSIRDLDDPWGRKRCDLQGETLSLDTIEHGLIRALFKDSRIHAAVNCASRSCPPLQPWAFRGDTVLDQLQRAMRSMVDSDTHVRIEPARLVVSRIFDWYGGDFTGAEMSPRADGVARYLADFAGAERRRRIEALGPKPRVDFLDYDWSLNSR